MTRISKTFKALVAGAFLLGAVEANAAASTAKPLRVGPVQVHGALNAKSGKIVGAKSGKEVMVRGMSLFWSDATGLQYYNKEVMKWAVENLKMDVVRYAMGVQYYDSQGGTNGKMDENYSYIGNPTLQKNKIDLMVEAAIENDIYIIIDWHSHRADQETSDAKAFFSEMATKYKNVPNIIWEVFNEPVNQSMSAIANYANSVISGIRSAGSQNLAIVGTPSWSQMNECNGVTDNNSAYVFHFYAASHSVGSYSGRISKCKNDGKAVFISEWGTTDANGSGNTNTSAASEWENFMEQNKISNCNWSLRNAESTIGEKTNEASAMFSGSTFLTKQSLLASAGYTTSGNHVKSYLTTHATDWASELVSGKNSGNCAFKAVTVKESAGSAASSLKSGCTYTSSDESVVTSAGAIKSAGFAIMTGNDGSQSVITVQAEPQQTVTDFKDFSCYVTKTCSGSMTIGDLDGDGKLEVIASVSGNTDQGSALTLKSLNENVVKVNKATCSATQGCYGKAKGASVTMYEFTGTIGEAKIVATAKETTGYSALNDTITITFTKNGDKLGDNFKDMKVEKNYAIAKVFLEQTTYGKATITYTFDGQPTSPYVSNVDGNLVTGNVDAIVKIRATAPETEQRAAVDKTITIIVGDSATAANSGHVSIPVVAKPAGKLSAQFVNGGLLLSTAQSGKASIQVITTLGQVAKSMQSELGAGNNWIPMSELSAGKYIVRVKQGSNIQSISIKVQ